MITKESIEAEGKIRFDEEIPRDQKAREARVDDLRRYLRKGDGQVRDIDEAIERLKNTACVYRSGLRQRILYEIGITRNYIPRKEEGKEDAPEK